MDELTIKLSREEARILLHNTRVCIDACNETIAWHVEHGWDYSRALKDKCICQSIIDKVQQGLLSE